MGFWDKMFGRGASDAEKQPDAQQRYNELVQKYQTALTVADREHIQFQALQVQDNKLFIRGIAPSGEARDRFWEQIRLVNPSEDDISTEITVTESQAQAATAGGESVPSAVTYTVKSGDTLSKISREYYGTSDEYMRIFYANRDKLRDPDKVQVGQELVIPPDDNG